MVFALSILPLALLVLPLLAIVPMSFTATEVIALPPDRFGFDAYRHLLAAPGWGDALLSSIEVAALAALLAVITGTTAAIGLGRLRGFAVHLVNGLVLAPLALPVVVLGLAQFEFFARLRFGVLLGIALAHGVMGVPYVFLTMRAALTRLDITIVRAAESLGAGALSVFRWVYLPTLLPAILAGMALAFGASFEEVVIALFLSGPHAITLPVKLYTELQYNLSPIVLAVATLILMAVLTAGLIARPWPERNGAPTRRGYDNAMVARADRGIVVDQVCKSFGTTEVLHHVGLTLADGEFLTLLGSSGSGKSTTLGIIAGFIKPTSATCGSAATPCAMCRRVAAIWASCSRITRCSPT